MIHPINALPGGSGLHVDRSAGCDTGWRTLPLSILETPFRGNWIVHLEGRVERVLSGEVLHLPADTPHRLSTAGGKGMTSTWVLMGWERSGIPIRTAAHFTILRKSRFRRAVVEMARLLARETTIAGEARFHAHALDILAEIGATEQPAITADPRITEVILHIRDHLAEPFDRARMARMAGLSESRFHDRFKAVTGEPLLQYVLRQRLQLAATRLLHSSMTVAEIGECCGFASPQYFSRVFRRETGLSPREFRRQWAPPACSL